MALQGAEFGQEENIEADEAQSPRVFNALNINMLQEKRVGYARPFMPDLPPEGNVLAANLRRNNEIGLYLNTIDFEDFNKPELADPNYNYIDHIPPRYYEEYGHMYALTYNKENADALTQQLDDEMNDRQIMANKPWRSGLSGIVAGLLSPTVFLPGGAIYRSTKLASGVAKSALAVSAGAAAQQSVEEMFRHQTQYTATLDESMFNVIGAGIVGGLLGGFGGAYVNGAIFNKAKQEVVNGLATDAPIGPSMTPKQSLSAAASRDPAYEKELYSMYGKGLGAGTAKFLAWTTHQMTPIGRLFFSPFPSSRKIVNELFENNLIINANVPGKKKVMGPDGKEIEVDRPAFEKPESIEREIKHLKSEMQKSLIDYQDIFYKQAGITGPFKGLKANFKNQGMQLGEWEKAVWRTVVSGVKNENSSVQEAADLIVNRFFNPVRDEYIRLGIFSEDITVKTAANYFMRVYNREKIRDPAQRIKTHAKFVDFIKKNNEELIALEPQIKKLESQIKALERKRKIDPKKKNQAIEDLKKKLAVIVPSHLYDSSGNIRKVIDPDYYSVEADKIIDNILGFGNEEKFNPIMSSLPSKRTNPLKERKFLIEDSLIEDELITSFLEVGPMFINATAPNIALIRFAKRIGYETEGEARGAKIKLLEDDYKAAVAANPEKEKKLYKRYLKDKKDIEAGFDVLKGIYGLGPNILDNSATKLLKNISNWNFLRYMGLIQLQALTDAGNIGLKHGFFRTIYGGIKPLLQSIEQSKFDKELLLDLGFGCNTLTGYRLKGLMDVDQTVGQTGLFTRAMDNFSAAYGNMTLMNQWTDAMEFLSGRISIGRTLRAIDDWAKTGSMAEKEALRLNALGISEAQYPIIHAQYKKHGGKTDGSYWVNWGKWDEDNQALGALQAFKRSIIEEVDQTVVSKPSAGGKPLYTHTALGKTLFQFKGFSHAATTKLLLSGLQRSDAEFFQGLTMVSVLALIGYAATSLARGQELDLSYDNLFKEMIDRSGIAGVFGNFYNTANKLGIFPGQPVTRYRNRGIFSTMGGPTVGAIEDTIQLAAKMNGDSPMNTNDMYKLLRFMPTQNWVFTHRINKQIAKDFADYLGWEESPE